MVTSREYPGASRRLSAHAVVIATVVDDTEEQRVARQSIGRGHRVGAVARAEAALDRDGDVRKRDRIWIGASGLSDADCAAHDDGSSSTCADTTREILGTPYQRPTAQNVAQDDWMVPCEQAGIIALCLVLMVLSGQFEDADSA